MAKKNEYFPQSISHPGKTLDEKLNELNMGPKEFAIRTGKPEKTISAILNGDSAITPDMAVRFESVLKIPAHFWLNNQRNYNEWIARVKRINSIEEALEWARSFPYAEMAKWGWVPGIRKTEEKVEELFKFFSFSTKRAWENYYYGQKLKVSFRISLKHTKEPYAVSAWLRQGEILAGELSAPNYNAGKFKQNLNLFKNIMAEQPKYFFKKLQELCLEAGVKVVYTPCLPKAPIHGSTRWMVNTPLIQLSARYKQNDRFWFTFFHEAGHILLHGKKYISIENVDFDDVDIKKEHEADDFAVDWTFSEEQEREVENSFPVTVDDVLAFAKKFNTHPALIIGRFQHKKLLHYNEGRQFIKPIDLTNIV